MNLYATQPLSQDLPNGSIIFLALKIFFALDTTEKRKLDCTRGGGILIPLTEWMGRSSKY